MPPWRTPSSPAKARQQTSNLTVYLTAPAKAESSSRPPPTQPLCLEPLTLRDGGGHPPFFVFEQFVLEAVEQGQPAGLDDVFADPDRTPDRVGIAPFDHHAHLGRGLGTSVDDAHLVIGQVHL